MKVDSYNLAFRDILFNLLCVLIVMIGALLWFINPKSEAKGVAKKAEFLIMIEWPQGNKDDVDLYVEDPLGNICFFRAREAGFMSLERDDTGTNADTFTLPDGEVIVFHENTETITLRSLMPGEYIANVHMYTKREEGATKVKMIATKLNPNVSVVMKEEVELSTTGDEKTTFRMVVDKDGKVIEISKLFKAIARHNAKVEHSSEDYPGAVE